MRQVATDRWDVATEEDAAQKSIYLANCLGQIVVDKFQPWTYAHVPSRKQEEIQLHKA
jgi:hypothetical protein